MSALLTVWNVPQKFSPDVTQKQRNDSVAPFFSFFLTNLYLRICLLLIFNKLAEICTWKAYYKLCIASVCLREPWQDGGVRRTTIFSKPYKLKDVKGEGMRKSGQKGRRVKGVVQSGKVIGEAVWTIILSESTLFRRFGRKNVFISAFVIPFSISFSKMLSCFEDDAVV